MTAVHDSIWTIVDRAAMLGMLIASIVVIRDVVLDRQARAVQAAVPSGQVAESVDLKVSADQIDAVRLEGNQGARLLLLEFSDYQCPFCNRASRDIFPRLKEDFVDKGTVRYAFMNFPLEQIHKEAFLAAESAECARTQGKFRQMQTWLFDHQQSLSRPGILRFGRELQLGEPTFETCLDGEMASRIRADMALGKHLGFTGTPGFAFGEFQRDGSVRVQRIIRGAAPYAAFDAVIRELTE